MRRSLAIAIALPMLGVVAAGCILVTGTTNGYVLEDAGTPSIEAGACIAEAGCVNLQCSSSLECGGGEVCCLALAGSLAGSTCQKQCQVGSVQLCKGGAECGDAVSCVSQQCVVLGLGVNLSICGLAAGCLEVSASGADAGADGSDAT